MNQSMVDSRLFPLELACTMLPLIIKSGSVMCNVLVAKTKINNPIDIYLIIRTATRENDDVVRYILLLH